MYKIVKKKKENFKVTGCFSNPGIQKYNLLNTMPHDVFNNKSLKNTPYLFIRINNSPSFKLSLKNVKKLIKTIKNNPNNTFRLPYLNSIIDTTPINIEELISCINYISSKIKDINLTIFNNYSIIEYFDTDTDFKENNILNKNRDFSKVLIFGDCIISYKMSDETFDLRDYSNKDYILSCNYCGEVCPDKGYKLDSKASLCKNCLYKITKICARIGGNQKLKQEISIKQI